MNQLLNKTKISVVAAAAAAATTDVTSDVVDMQGFEGVIFLALTGDVTDTSVLTLTVKTNTASSTSSPTPLTATSATFTAGATSADSKLLAVELVKPVPRYCFAVLSRATANAVVGGIIAIQFNGRLTVQEAHATLLAQATALGVSA